MARTNPNQEILENPAELFIEWSGSKGLFQYYDKEKSETVELKLPFTFIPLDSLHTLKGFSEKDESGLWSNEVKDIKNQVFKVKSKNGVEFEGVYNTFSEAFKNKGGKYGHSLYVAIKDSEGKLFIANIFMGGSALSGGSYKDKDKKEIIVNGWMDFIKGHKIYEGAIQVKDSTQCVKGATKYQVPNFTQIPVAPATDDEAGILQTQVFEYVKTYLTKTQGSAAEEKELAKMVESAHAEAFGGTPAELTNKEEQIFGGAKEVIDAGPLGEMGDLPDFEGPSQDLPF
jgi:hypothetical protein